MRFNLGAIDVDVTLKKIKNIHLSVHPPTGRVRISAPSHMNLENIRIFAISKLGWIKQQQKKLREQARETKREYLERESHFLWGRRYLLQVMESNSPPMIEHRQSKLILRIRPKASKAKRQELFDEWYRSQIKSIAPALVEKWEPLIGVKVGKVYVQRMKTKWGSCNPNSKSIRLNTDLAKKPRECLEYIVVHEIAHLIEPTHNLRFVELMDRLMPKWKFYKEMLNRLPVRHEDWDY